MVRAVVWRTSPRAPDFVIDLNPNSCIIRGWWQQRQTQIANSSWSSWPPRSWSLTWKKQPELVTPLQDLWRVACSECSQMNASITLQGRWCSGGWSIQPMVHGLFLSAQTIGWSPPCKSAWINQSGISPCKEPTNDQRTDPHCCCIDDDTWTGR